MKNFFFLKVHSQYPENTPSLCDLQKAIEEYDSRSENLDHMHVGFKYFK